MTPDIVIPVRPNPKDDQLRYTLRAIHAHVPDLAERRIVIAGGLPAYIPTATVTHLATVQDSDPWTNVGRNLTTALDHIDQDWLWWWQDDIYPLKPVAHIPLYARHGTIGSYTAALTRTNAWKAHSYLKQYVTGVLAQQAILIEWGFDPDETPNGCCHTPTPIHVPTLQDILDRLTDECPSHALGHFKALYAAVMWRNGTPVQHIVDPKIIRPDRAITNMAWVSTSGPSWKGSAGQTIRTMFPDPSPYEIPPPAAAPRQQVNHRTRRQPRTPRQKHPLRWQA